MKTLFRAISKNRKVVAFMNETEDGNYKVIARIGSMRREFNYTHYNHACYKFECFRNFIKNSIDR